MHTSYIKESDKATHMSILDYIHKLYVQRQEEYGDSFHKLHEQLGVIADMTQIAHKYNRAMNQVKKHPDAYSYKEYDDYDDVRDTFIDLANYCIMTVMEMDKDIEACFEQKASEKDMFKKLDKPVKTPNGPSLRKPMNEPFNDPNKYSENSKNLDLNKYKEDCKGIDLFKEQIRYDGTANEGWE